MPLDGQIYWNGFSPSIFAKPGEGEFTAFQDVRFGETETEDSHSTFRFSGRRRERIADFSQLMHRDNRGLFDVIDNENSLINTWYGTNYTAACTYSWPGFDGYGDQLNNEITHNDISNVFKDGGSEADLEASKNRESCHWLSNVALMQTIDHPFIGIHKDKPLTLNITKNYAGFYLVLERIRHQYNELYIRPVHAQIFNNYLDGEAQAVKDFYKGTLPDMFDWLNYYSWGELGGSVMLGYNFLPCDHELFTGKKEIFKGADGVVGTADDNNNFNFNTSRIKRINDFDNQGDFKGFSIQTVFKDKIPALFLRDEYDKGTMDWTIGQQSVFINPNGEDYVRYSEPTETIYYYWIRMAPIFWEYASYGEKYHAYANLEMDTNYEPAIPRESQITKNRYEALGNKFELEYAEDLYTNGSTIAQIKELMQGENDSYLFSQEEAESYGRAAMLIPYKGHNGYNNDALLDSGDPGLFGDAKDHGRAPFDGIVRQVTNKRFLHEYKTPTMSQWEVTPRSGRIVFENPFYYTDFHYRQDFGADDATNGIENTIGVVRFYNSRQAGAEAGSKDKVSTYPVKDAVIHPRYNRKLRTYTGSILLKNMTIKIGGNVMKAEDDARGKFNEMSNIQIFNGENKKDTPIVANGAKNQKNVTFSNLYSYANSIDHYIDSSFEIEFEGDDNRYTIDSVSTSRITLNENLSKTLSSSNFTLFIPRGSRDANYTWGNYKLEKFYDSWKQEVWPKQSIRRYDFIDGDWTRDEIIESSNPYDDSWEGERAYRCAQSFVSYRNDYFFNTNESLRQNYEYNEVSKTSYWIDSAADSFRHELLDTTVNDSRCLTDIYDDLAGGQKDGIRKMPKRHPFFANEFTESLMIDYNYHGIAYWERMVPQAVNGAWGGVSSKMPKRDEIVFDKSERPMDVSWDACSWVRYFEKIKTAWRTGPADLNLVAYLKENAPEICPWEWFIWFAEPISFSDISTERNNSNFENMYENQLASIWGDKNNRGQVVDLRVNEFVWGGLDAASSAIWPNYKNNVAFISPRWFNYGISTYYSGFSSEVQEAYPNNTPLGNELDKAWFSFCAAEKDPTMFRIYTMPEAYLLYPMAWMYAGADNPMNFSKTLGDIHKIGDRLVEEWASDCWTSKTNKVDYTSVSIGSTKASGTSGTKTVTLSDNIPSIEDKSETKYFTFVYSGVEYDIITKSGNTLTLNKNLNSTFNNTSSFGIRNKKMPTQQNLDQREVVKSRKDYWERVLYTKSKKNLLHPWCLAQYGYDADLLGILSLYASSEDTGANAWYGNEREARKYGVPHFLTIYESDEILSRGSKIEVMLHQAGCPFNQELLDDKGDAIEEEILIGHGRSTLPCDTYRLYIVAKYEVDSEEFAEVSKETDDRDDQSTTNPADYKTDVNEFSVDRDGSIDTLDEQKEIPDGYDKDTDYTED